MKKGKNLLCAGIGMLVLFGIFTWLLQTVDVKPAGETGTAIGFAALNSWFHRLTGVHWAVYELTDWLGLVPVFVCFLFGTLGLIQLLQRKSLFHVDRDLLLLGLYYIIVIGCYLLFEQFPLNYRPVFIEGRREASYPSSTTLLVVSVMPTLVFQIRSRLQQTKTARIIIRCAEIFTAGMVAGRLVAGIHWLTDIFGALLLSAGLFLLYQAAVLLWPGENH